MGHRFHRGFTAAEKTELWDRWKRGESLKAIGRAFGKPSSSIYFLVAPHGGIRPAQRRRSRLALTLAKQFLAATAQGFASHGAGTHLVRPRRGITFCTAFSGRSPLEKSSSQRSR